VRDRHAAVYRFVGCSRTGCAPTKSGTQRLILDPPTCLPICRSALVRDRGARMHRSVGWSRTSALLQGSGMVQQRRAVRLLIRLLPPGSPYDAAGGWRKARRVAAWMRPVFRQDRDVLSKNPVTRTRTWRAKPGRRVIRGALSFGHFSLGKQRKVTRAAAAARKPAAREPDRGKATIEDLRYATITFALEEKMRSKPTRQTETFPRAPAPHPNPLPAGERE